MFFFQFFMICCLAAYLNSLFQLKNVLSSRVNTLHSVVGNGHIFHPFLGNDQVQVCIMSFMILFHSKNLYNK